MFKLKTVLKLPWFTVVFCCWLAGIFVGPLKCSGLILPQAIDRTRFGGPLSSRPGEHQYRHLHYNGLCKIGEGILTSPYGQTYSVSLPRLSKYAVT